MANRGKLGQWISICVSSLCALSCGGATFGGDTSPHPAEATKHTREEARPTAESKERRADESAKNGHSPSASAAPVERQTPSTRRLKLSVNDAFLQARLPERVPGRYGRWQQAISIYVGRSHLSHASFVDDGRTILAQSSVEGSVRVYDRKSRALITKHDFPLAGSRPPFLIPFDPLPGSAPGATNHFAVATRSGVDLHEVRTGKVAARLIDGQIDELLLSPDKSILMAKRTNDNGHSVLSFYERTGPSSILFRGELPMKERVDAWDLSRDNRLLAVTHYPSDDLLVYDLHTGATITHTRAPQYTASVAFSPDGRFIAAGGKGLLLVDLVNPTRRAFFSHIYGNINTVRFSPSGDAIAISSYDGYIRILGYQTSGPSLELIRTLRHGGNANVYRIQFDEEGNSLVSSSGDQTVRVFGGSYRPTSRSPESDEFRTLEEWKAAVPDAEKRVVQPPEPSMQLGHYHPPSLDAEPRPCRIAPGKYACRVSSMYKLRDCTVTQTAKGHTLLKFEDGNLLELEGILYDDGPVVRYEAWETSGGSVIACDGCNRQPIHAIFRGSGRNFTGLLLYRPYYDPYRPPPLPAAGVKIEEAEDRFPLTLRFKSPLPTSPTPPRNDRAIPIDPRLVPIP